MLHYTTSSGLFIITLLSTVISFGSPSDIDSTISSIDFVKMVATPASKIIHFKWDVNAETKGDYFLIEKSIDNKNWNTVTRVESLGYHKDRHTYMVSEINLAESALELFRIKRVDKWSNETILDVVNVKQPILSSLILIPQSKTENNQLIVSYTSLLSSHGTIRVFNMDGETLFEEHMELSFGYNRVVVDTRKFEFGNYIIIVRDEFDNKLSKSLILENTKNRKSKF